MKWPSFRGSNSSVLDLSSYLEKVHTDEDRPLLIDAERAARVGALRAAYIMIWLACAESLKRRFREAMKRDANAGRVVGEIQRREAAHQSVDRYLIDEAQEYGFITDSGKTLLAHVYEMRCIYGHPYEQAPSVEQVSHAAAVATSELLSKAVKLKHGFANKLIENLLTVPAFLDDQEVAVASFAKDIIPRLDDEIHPWLAEKYWDKLEPLEGDASVAMFFRRGVWFSKQLLRSVGTVIFSQEQWHEKVGKHPRVLMIICGEPDIFREIGRLAQDSLVAEVINKSQTRSGVLRLLETLGDHGALSDRQLEKFHSRIGKMTPEELRSSSLRTNTCFESLIGFLMSYDWFVQNPAMELIESNGAEQAEQLDEEEQVRLGRNILQAAEGRSNSASSFLWRLSENNASWPFDILRGIFLECFANERNEIRFKERHLSKVLSVVDQLTPPEQQRLVLEVSQAIDTGVPKHSWLTKECAQSVIHALNDHPWARELVQSIEAKKARFPEEVLIF